MKKTLLLTAIMLFLAGNLAAQVPDLVVVGLPPDTIEDSALTSANVGGAMILTRDSTVVSYEYVNEIIFMFGRVYVMGSGWADKGTIIVKSVGTNGEDAQIRQQYKLVFNKQDGTIGENALVFYDDAVEVNNKYFNGWSIIGVGSWYSKAQLAVDEATYLKTLADLSSTGMYKLQDEGTNFRGSYKIYVKQ